MLGKEQQQKNYGVFFWFGLLHVIVNQRKYILYRIFRSSISIQPLANRVKAVKRLLFGCTGGNKCAEHFIEAECKTKENAIYRLMFLRLLHIQFNIPWHWICNAMQIYGRMFEERMQMKELCGQPMSRFEYVIHFTLARPLSVSLSFRSVPSLFPLSFSVPFGHSLLFYVLAIFSLNLWPKEFHKKSSTEKIEKNQEVKKQARKNKSPNHNDICLA